MRIYLTPLALSSIAISSSQVSYGYPVEIPEAQVKLTPIVIEAATTDEVGQIIYQQEQIKNAANAKRSITDFLKRHTNIQFDRNSGKAGEQASLAVDKISINGAPSFDNLFLVNGVNTSNLFDPIGEQADSNYQGMPANSQTANINTDLLCELKVIDSNASVEYGQFLGGVISTKTCAPRTRIGEIHGQLSFDYTNDSWARFNYLNTDEREHFEKNQDMTHQREYTTQGLSGNLYGRLNEEWSFNLSASNRQSRIPVMSGFAEGDKIPTLQNNDSLGLTAFFNPNKNHNFQFGLEHYDYNKDGYYNNVIHSDYQTETLTNTAFIQAKHLFENFQIEHHLHYRTSKLERQLKQNSSVSWYYAKGSKDWRPDVTDGDSLTIGGFGGDLINKQDSLSYQFTTRLNAFDIGDTRHQFKFGGSYQHHTGHWERPHDMVLYTTRSDLGTAKCASGDSLCDEANLLYRPNKKTAFTEWQGQFSRYGTIYSAAQYMARQDQSALFIEDDISWKTLRARFGLRADYDSLASSINIAPRLSLHYKPFSNDVLQLTGGLNRYYGNTFLISELDEKIWRHQGTLSRATQYDPNWSQSNNYGWSLSQSNSTAGVRATDLDTPYSDERVFAIHSEWNDFDIELKWVNREFNNILREIRVFKLNDNHVEVLDYRTFHNVDGGEANTYSLNIGHAKLFQLFNTTHQFNLGLSYIKNNTLRGDYKDADNNTRDEYIYYQGNILRKSMLPTKDSPFSARLSWDIQGLNHPFRMSHFFNFRSQYRNYVDTDETHTLMTGTEMPVYAQKDFASHFTWDIRTTYQWKLAQNKALIFGLTSTNVLNKKNYTVTENGEADSREGRRIFADLTYKF